MHISTIFKSFFYSISDSCYNYESVYRSKYSSSTDSDSFSDSESIYVHKCSLSLILILLQNQFMHIHTILSQILILNLAIVFGYLGTAVCYSPDTPLVFHCTGMQNFCHQGRHTSAYVFETL